MLVIEIPWDPYIATFGGVLLSWHGFFTAVGVVAGVQLSLRMGRVVGYDEDAAYTLALIGVPSGIIGARLLFVWERGDWDLARVIAINEGGISIWGAILGGVIGAVAFALWRHYPVGRGLDIAAFGIILGQAIGRLGDLVNGEHLGRPTELPWGVIYTHPDSPAWVHSLTVGAHHPATTYELIGDLIILATLFVLLFYVFVRRPGLTFFGYLICYAVMRFFLTYLRVDSAELLGLRVPQVVSLIVLLAAVPSVWYFAKQPLEADPQHRNSSSPRRRTVRR